MSLINKFGYGMTTNDSQSAFNNLSAMAGGSQNLGRLSMMTMDSMTRDSTGAFLIGELERLDQTLHMPLVDITYSRDILFRTDVSIADESSSYTLSTFASPGGATNNGINWIGKDSTAIPSIQLDIGKTVNPLFLWGSSIPYTIPELASAQQLGRPIDVQKYQGMNLKYEMDVDQMVYLGDTTLGATRTGMINAPSTVVAPINASTTGGATTWAAKVALGTQAGLNAILADVNTLIVGAWTSSAYAVVPRTLLLPPSQYALLTSTLVSQAGSISLLQFIKQNSITLAKHGIPLEILPVKWLAGAGVSSVDRAMVYTNDMHYIRYPIVPLQRTPLQYQGIYHLVYYFGRLGITEIVYPETVAYMDGI